MSDNIELVIKLPKNIYKHIMSMQFYISGPRSGKSLIEKILRAIRTGEPLPKGHGRLIILSEDAVKREQTPLDFSCQSWISEVGLSNATVAIIEADKENEK